MSCERYLLQVPPPQSVNLIVPPNGPAVIATPGTPQVTLAVPPPVEHRLAVPPEPSASLIVQERVGPPGPPGPPGSGISESLTGLIDGSNLVFAASRPIFVGSEAVTVNGLEQDLSHYWVLDYQILFADPPEPGDLLRIRYQPTSTP